MILKNCAYFNLFFSFSCLVWRLDKYFRFLARNSGRTAFFMPKNKNKFDLNAK